MERNTKQQQQQQEKLREQAPWAATGEQLLRHDETEYIKHDTYLRFRSSNRLSHWRVKRSHGSRLLNHRRILIDLGRDTGLLFRFGLEKIADTSRQTTTNFSQIRLLVLLIEMRWTHQTHD